MAITDIDKIDQISLGPDNRCYLTISDHLNWEDEDGHLNHLQNKLNGYVGFVQSGQLSTEYQNLEIVIQVIAKYDIPLEIYNAAENQISANLKQDGIDFRWSKLTD
jgi:hypothetical protein